MHYHAEIHISELVDLEKQIESILAPFDESLEVEAYEEDGETYHRNPKGFWDWWQIGGRWTGSHDDYDPSKDEDNYERCDLCGGTGFRRDRVGDAARIESPSYTCNGCGHYNQEKKLWQHSEYQQGWRLKWPTQWKRHFGDVVPVSKIDEELACRTLIIRGDVLHTDVWDGNEWKDTDFNGKVKQKLSDMGITDGYLVTVDYHS